MRCLTSFGWGRITLASIADAHHGPLHHVIIPLLLALLCGHVGHAKVSGITQSAEKRQEIPPAGEQSEPSVNEAYFLQSGDEISIRIYGRPELEDTVRIRPDGMISLVLLDDLKAAGLTPMQLDELLTQRYSEFFRNPQPQVTVVVRTLANYKVFVAGEVRSPGPVALSSELTALAAVIQAGGFLGTARTDNVILLRNEGNVEPTVTKLNLKDVLNKGTLDVELKPYDVVYVPASRIAKVDRFVDQYIRQLIPISFTFGFTYLLGGRAVIVP
jgi:polysaccharide export outer membrane protein